jgi:predicted amidohydrolase
LTQRRASLRIYLAQIAPALGDLARNCELHLEQVGSARGEHADLVVFPELSLTGYWLHDMVSEVALDPETAPVLAPLRAVSRDLDIVLGVVEDGGDGRSYNTTILLRGERVAWRHRKLHLPTYTLFDEGRYFSPGNELQTFTTGGARAGLLICEDMWHSSLAWLLAQEGCDLLLVPSCGPARGPADGGIGSQHDWRLLGETAARFHAQFVVYVNRTGSEDGYTFAGGSFVYGPDGKLLAALPDIDDAGALVELDLGAINRARSVHPMRRDARPELVRRELDRLLAGPGAPAVRAHK